MNFEYIVQSIPASSGETPVFLNFALISKDDPSVPSKGLFYIKATTKENRTLFYTAQCANNIPRNQLCFSLFQRKEGQYSFGTVLKIEINIPTIALNQITFSIIPFSVSRDPIIVDCEQLAVFFRATFNGHLFCLGQEYCCEYRGIRLQLRCVGSLNGTNLQQGQLENACSQGILTELTGIIFSTENPKIILDNSDTIDPTGAVFTENFSFEGLGIGGLDSQLENIFRQAFVSRVVSRDSIKNLGIQHAKGMILYGPPGTGKTLIARQIGKMLNGHPPQIVNGPQILSKYVGESEERIRKLFEPAEAEQRDKGDLSKLHIIIFDEIDAICKSRGSVQDGSGVHDTIVNQLLTKIDGIDQLNNILVIGMTNRPELIDDALTRQGRLEIKVEIGLPDERGRLQILNIHTEHMQKSGVLDPNVSLTEIASITKNYSGAELKGLIRNAGSHALYRNVDQSNPQKIICNDVRVGKQDFTSAFSEIKPLFGADTQSHIGKEVLLDYPESKNRWQNISHYMFQKAGSGSQGSLVSTLFHGPAGSGKTALAYRLANESGTPFCRIISPNDLYALGEVGKRTRIAKVFEDAYKSPNSCIILDNLERLIEWTSLGSRYSQSILQCLMTLLQKEPPKGHTLLIIGTTSNIEAIKALDLYDQFMCHELIPELDRCDLQFVLHENNVPDSVISRIISDNLVNNSITIKKVLSILAMAQAQGPLDEDLLVMHLM
jgi:vesicle-fusing ATPase